MLDHLSIQCADLSAAGIATARPDGGVPSGRAARTGRGPAQLAVQLRVGVPLLPLQVPWTPKVVFPPAAIAPL